MAYTLWHSGILLGKSDLSFPSGNPAQRGGILHPTPYGLTLLPRLTRTLSIGYEFKSHIESMWRTADDLSGHEIEELLTTSDAGRAMIEMGRLLSNVGLRAPNGQPLEFKSIAFSDVDEIRRIGKATNTGVDDALENLPPDAPRFMVSATLRSRTGWLRRIARARR